MYLQSVVGSYAVAPYACAFLDVPAVPLCFGTFLDVPAVRLCLWGFLDIPVVLLYL